MFSLPRLAALAPLLSLFALACDQTVAGKDDVLRFRYDADDNLLPVPFNTPVGAGFAVDVEVFSKPDGGDEVSAAVVDAESSNADVVSVVATVGNVVTLLAKGTGKAEIAVQSARGEDRFDVTVVDVVKADLSHPGFIVSDAPPSKGIVGGTARFIVALKQANGDAAVGVGNVPAEVAPTTAATVLDSEHIGFVPVRFAAPGTATITALGDDPITVEIIEDAAVTALDLQIPDQLPQIPVGTNISAVLRGLTADNDKVVGVASLANVVSSDPAICDIVADASLGEGAYLVVPKAPGECTVTATLGARGTSETLTVRAR